MKVCKIPDCNKEAQARGWCSMHYARWRKHGKTDDPPRPYGCKVEGCDKPHNAKGYCRVHYGHLKNGRIPSLYRLCKRCDQPITDRVGHAEFHYECLDDHYSDYRYKKTFGISLTQYRNLFEFQNGRCAVCQKQHEKLDVDHEHISGVVRGLLCGNCNRALGLVKDNTYVLQRAVDYLRFPPFLHLLTINPNYVDPDYVS